IKAKEDQLKVYKEVEESLRPLKQDSTLFNYDEHYKRFLLSFDVKFVVGKAGINEHDLYNYEKTETNIVQAGKKLKSVLDNIIDEAVQQNTSSTNKVTYLVIITGYASKLENRDTSPGGMYNEYQLSYARAYSLWSFWRETGINFESSRYRGLIDLQLAGNGWGGVGRGLNNEEANQRFIVQVVPKISNQSITN